jgi:ribose transport system permease protein
MRKEFGIFALLAFLCVVVAVLNPQFASPTNIQNTTRLIGMFGIFSIGVGVVIITGGIDLSVGSLFALLGVLMSIMLVRWEWPPLAALAAVMAVAVGLGSIHGWLIARVQLQPFIVTLCGLLLYRGLARYIAADATQGFGNAENFPWLRDLVAGNVAGLPAPFVLLAIVASLMWVLMHRTVFGRYVFAIGRNEEAARYAGIDAKKIKIAAYAISGALAGIGAILLAFYTNSIAPSSHGNFYELYAIAAAVLGGCSLRGGEGSVIGIVLGAALLQVLRNLVNLLDIPSSLDFAVMGVVILIGAIADQMAKSRRKLA